MDFLPSPTHRVDARQLLSQHHHHGNDERLEEAGRPNHLEEVDLLDSLGGLPLGLVLLDLAVDVHASPQPRQSGDGPRLVVLVQQQVLGGLGAKRQSEKLQKK